METEETWANSPDLARIDKGVEKLLASMPSAVKGKSKLEIRDKKGYVQVLVVCEFEVNWKEK